MGWIPRCSAAVVECPFLGVKNAPQLAATGIFYLIMEEKGLIVCQEQCLVLDHPRIFWRKFVGFQDKKIRRIWHNNEWYFSVVDVIEALTDSPSPRQYWGVLKGRETQLLTFCLQLKLQSSDSKYYVTDCANTQGMFRIIQSIPSPKAEPFKLWLAQVGYERVQEYKDFKGLQNKNQNLRDHMSDWELIFTMLGEKATTDITIAKDATHTTTEIITIDVENVNRVPVFDDGSFE